MALLMVFIWNMMTQTEIKALSLPGFSREAHASSMAREEPVDLWGSWVMQLLQEQETRARIRASQPIEASPLDPPDLSQCVSDNLYTHSGSHSGSQGKWRSLGDNY